MGGGPIMLWNASGTGAIIGVHNHGDGVKNWGSGFIDDKGLMEVFETKRLAAFLANCKTYKPQLSYGESDAECFY